MLGPASDRFHTLVYQRMMAANESQAEAWSYCQGAHKATWDLYQQESAQSEAATTAENEAAENARRDKINGRRERIAAVTDLVDAHMREHPGGTYDGAYATVRLSHPHLFKAMDAAAAANTATNG